MLNLARPGAAFALLVLGLFGGGCASPTDDLNQPPSGRGIAEYREVTHDAHQAVAAVLRSLEALAAPSSKAFPAHAALPGFDRALHQLELTSIRARARAEALIARGQSYFDEWKENLNATNPSPAPQGSPETYERLLQQFNRVQKHSGEVREQFRPFMGRLREFRARLDRPSSSGGWTEEAFRKELETVTAGGRQVLSTLDALRQALDQAEGELRSTQARKG